METHHALPAYELKNPLARRSLPASRREADQKLAWVNSICFLFLLIGLLGARRGLIAIKPAPPLRQSVPVMLEPVTRPRPAETTQPVKSTATQNNAPRVVVALPQAPSIHFRVPTLGSLVVPASLAAAPPLEPLRVFKKLTLGSLTNTGHSGDRPEPPYPPIALESGEQGTVVLLLTGDAAGNVITATVKTSSGFPVLDHATLDFVKHHWRLPAGKPGQSYLTRITYRLQIN